MPYNWNDEYIESIADKNTDILVFGEIGGVGQLIYHSFRFADYKLKNKKSRGCLPVPSVTKNLWI